MASAKRDKRDWIDEILRGVKVLPKKGIPGQVTVFGEQAEPILTGAKDDDVLVGAAEFGRGRIVTISHDGYAKEFFDDNKPTQDIDRFHENLKKWLTRGKYKTVKDIIRASDVTSHHDLAKYRIVVWNGGQAKIPEDKLSQYISNGGSLLHCLTPWGWLQTHKEKSLSDVPYASLLIEAGLFYTKDYISAPDGGFSVKDNKANTGDKEELEKASATKWREEILRGVKLLPKIGSPGQVVVFGERAEPIITGENDEDVLVAAAEFGKGRIVIIAHSGYAKEFVSDKKPTQDIEEFQENLKKWLTKGKYKTSKDIIRASDYKNGQDLAGHKIVVWDGGQAKIPVDSLSEFVRKGGSLLHCATPWGWLQLNSGKSLTEIPYSSLLIEAGLWYTDDMLNVPANGFSVKDNKSKDSHLFRTIREAASDFNKALQNPRLYKTLKYVPESACCTVKHQVEKHWKTCQEEIKRNSSFPSKQNPVKNKKDRGILDLWQLYVDILKVSNIKAPGVDIFPGDFITSPPMTCNVLDFHSDREDYYSTASYAPPGVTVKVQVTSGNTGKDWRIMIGCHTDDLKSDNVRRWPKVNKTVKLSTETMEISSPFGGLIYFISPDKPNSKMSIRLENVVDSPCFKLMDGEKGRAVWNTCREYPGLWADICGQYVTITLPSSSVRALEFDALTSVMKTWDSVVCLYHDLRGTDVSKFRRQWMVADEQPGAGYMHAGYPIVTHLDVSDPKHDNFLLNAVGLVKKGNWGMFHEVGHNMQRPEWTFSGTGEVTVNIFTLCAMDSICGLKPWIHSWLQNQVKDADQYFQNGANFDKWKASAGMALFIYAQLIHGFGWESYKKVFRRYENMPGSEKPKEDDKKIDTWFSVFSETVGYNLGPLARFWNIPMSNAAVEDLKRRFSKGYLPDDEITRLAPSRVDKILEEFPMTLRNI